MTRHAPLDAIAETLTAMRARGGFATRIALAPDDLRLAVDGVGSIRLPVSAATTRALVGVARPALYGLGERTLYDPRVRDTWTIAKSRVKPDRRTWGPRLTAVLERVRRNLGLSDACTLTAELHDLLVYERGQFFLPHQDTEKHDDMVGTLVVMLPSACAGGALAIAHHDERMVVRGSADKLTCVAFYADCRHEVQPVRSGVRVVLTYDLRLGSAGKAAGASVDERAVAELARRVQAHFETPVVGWRPTEVTEPPDRLVVLLDHEYTQRGLEWMRLKNADAVRAAALREVALRLDCEVALALADVHETWNCEYDGRSSRRGWRRWDDDDGEPDDASEARPIDLVQAEVELRHVVGHAREGTAAKGGVDFDEEVCWTKPSDELEPFESAYEGYQGNYGNTLDR